LRRAWEISNDSQYARGIVDDASAGDNESSAVSICKGIGRRSGVEQHFADHGGGRERDRCRI
jgi:hypothetical protein